MARVAPRAAGAARRRRTSHAPHHPGSRAGTLQHAMGERLDRERGERLGPGGFVYLPGMMPHSVWTEAAEAVVQVTGTGPFGLLYVNPADNPGKAR
ncbi:cupin domain-containing protein [Paracraurococcus lichenis]|uniref:Cupin domain-containing protein n=1 Tax=Paracraurococcus lichenis TaxID=3064888 RepID=A0ABT9DT47_9PROT|nr:hypothetical protein [Paracraurococcus sp. LOR1-02]MDO9707069.1 hypothetical protein [Paracraurococcus sp. LOR1-02]